MIGNQIAAGQALTIANDSFNGDGSTVAFTLSQTVSSVNDIEVLVDNVQQSPYDSSYSVSGTTLTFSGAPSTGTNNVYVIYNASKHITTSQVIPDDGSITHSKIHSSGTIVTKSNTAPSSPANGDVWYDTDDFKIQFWDGTSWQLIKGSFNAAGGTITESGGFKYHTFTSSGNFTVSKGTNAVEYLIVAGGGSHRSGSHATGAGGGGAGGVIDSTTTVSTGSYSIVIGAGGTGATGSGNGNSGGNSTAFGGTAIGGGRGGAYSGYHADSGGSGGGGGYNANAGAGTAGQGNAGGTGTGGSQRGGGGGGGFGAVGGNSSGSGSSTVAGNGGVGINWKSLGTYYAGGGGGGISPWSEGGKTAGTGGLGGGGNGARASSINTYLAGDAGGANTGGGVGGASVNGSVGDDAAAANGGSGIVIIRYQV